MFFNIPLLYDLILKNDIITLKKLFLHESYSLFRTREDAINFIEKINLNEDNVMKIIFKTISRAIVEINEKKQKQIHLQTNRYPVSIHLE